MPKRNKGRPISGLLLLDKPSGITSNAALQRVKRCFNAAKAGHTGSLDPLATGLLPICLGEATKFSQYLLDADKTYTTQALLGRVTDTGDTDGAVVAEYPVPALNEAGIEAALAPLRGDIAQVPPMYSALKVGGKKLYELARQGKEVTRQPRPVTIHELVLLGWNQKTLGLRVRCSKGTYVRSLVESIGEALGCGACVSELRREHSAGFSLAQAMTLQQLEAAAEQAQDIDHHLLPVDEIVSHFPEIRLNSAQSESLLHGQQVRIAPLNQAGPHRLYQPNDQFIGLGDAIGDTVRPLRLISTSARL